MFWNKLHACCHGTHAMIEAIKALQHVQSFAVGDIEKLTVETHSRWLKVCDIKEPRTGLEVKFSYVHLAAMTLQRIDTSADTTFTDALLQCVITMQWRAILSSTTARISFTAKKALSVRTTRLAGK